MSTTKLLGFAGLLASIIVGVGEYLLHYSPDILESAGEYDFLRFVSLDRLKAGHFLSIAGLPFYFAGYLHIYRMLEPGNNLLARTTLGISFVAFSVGGIWIGSRAFLGNIMHLQNEIPQATFQNILENYTELMEVLVQALRIIIALLSIVFVIAILKGKTMYRKWMAIFNPITILLAWVLLGTLIPAIGNHVLPILMNATHFVLFGISLFQLQDYSKRLNA